MKTCLRGESENSQYNLLVDEKVEAQHPQATAESGSECTNCDS